MNQGNLPINSCGAMYLRRRGVNFSRECYDNNCQGSAVKWDRDVATTEGASLTKIAKDSTNQLLVEIKQAIDGHDIPLIDRILKEHPDVVNQISYHSSFGGRATMLSYAIYKDNLEAVKAFLANDPDVDMIVEGAEFKKTLVYQAASLDDPSILKEILKKSTKQINTKSGCFTPLHLAVTCGHTKTAKALIDKGADLTSYSVASDSDNPLNSLGATPLMYAVYNLDIPMVKLLVAEGADIKKGTCFYTFDNLIVEEIGVVESMKYYHCFKAHKDNATGKKFELLAFFSECGAPIDLEVLEAINNGSK